LLQRLRILKVIGFVLSKIFNEVVTETRGSMKK